MQEESQYSCFSSLLKIADLQSDILSITCTDKNIYFSTKNAIFQKPQGKTLTKESDYSRVNLDGYFREMNYIKSENDVVLVALIGKEVFMLSEKEWPGKFVPTGIKGTPFIATTQDHENLIIVDQKLISKFKLSNGKLQLSNSQVAHRMKPISVAVGRSNIAILEKGSVHVFDNFLKEIITVQMPKDSKYIVDVKDTDQFAFIHNGKSEYFGQDRVVKPEFATFEDDPSQMIVIPPYAFSLQQHSISVKSTIAPIAEEIQLPFKNKGGCLAVLDNFTVIVSQHKSIYMSRYSTADNHIRYLSVHLKKWENAIDFCRSFTNPYFQTSGKLSDLYKCYSESMFQLKKYDESFDLFQKSGKHPFEILRIFKSFATDKLKEAIEADLNDTEDAIKDLLFTLSCDPDSSNERPIVDQFQIDPNEVQNAYKKLSEIKQIDVEIPNLDFILEHCNEIANNAWYELNELNKVRNNTQNLFNYQSQKTKDNQAIHFLQIYLNKLVRSEKQSTCLKIYNTMLLQCYAKLAPLKLEVFIKENPPLFFDVAYSVLVDQNQNQSILSICELHRKHSLAIKFLLEQNEVMTAIKYIKSSRDWKTIGQQFFDQILTSLSNQEKDQSLFKQLKSAPEVFFSNQLQVTDIDEIMNKLKETRNLELRSIFIVHFLEFAIYERKLFSPKCNQKLIKTYLKLLKPYSEEKERMKKIILIENEEEPVKSYRKGLLRILEANGQKAADREYIQVVLKIPKCFVEEMIVAYKSINNPFEALDLFRDETDMKVVFYLLDKLYDPDHSNSSEIYHNYISRHCMNDKNQIPEFLNNCADRVDPSVVLGFFSDLPDVASLYKFLSYTTTTHNNKSRLVKIQNALMKDLIKKKRQQLSYLKGGYVEINENTICSVCGKPIGDSNFYVFKSNNIMHVSCKPEEDLE